jgi:WD40 repeat protein
MQRNSRFRSTIEMLALICILLVSETCRGWTQNLAIVPTPNIGHTKDVGLLAVSADGQYLASSDGATIRLWQLASGRLMRTLDPVPAPPPEKDTSEDPAEREIREPEIKGVVFAKDGASVIASDDSDRLHQWDALSGRLRKTVDARGWLSSIEISADGSAIMSICAYGDDKCGIAAWDPRTLEQRGAREGKAERIAINPIGTEAVAISRDSAVLLSLPSLGMKKSLPVAKGADRARITDIGDELATLHHSGDFIIWRFIELASGDVRREFKLSRDEGYNIGHMELGPGSRLLVTKTPRLVSSDQSIVEILSLAPGGYEKVRLAKDFEPTAAVFSRDGSSVITARGNLIEIWDTRTGVLQKTLQGPLTIKAISSSADGRYLAALDADGSAFLWRPFEVELNQPPLLNTARIEDAALSHDGQTLSVATDDGSLIARQTNSNAGSSLPQGWRLKNGDSTRSTRRSAFDAPPTGVVRDDNFEFGLWDSENSAFRRQLTLPKDAGHPDLATSSGDGLWAILRKESSTSLLLWNLEKNAVELRLASVRGKPVVDASFSPDSKFVAIIASNSTMRPEDVKDGGVVQVRRLSDRKIVKELRIKGGPSLEAVEFSPNGKYLIVHTIQFEQFGRHVFRTSDWKRVDQEEHIHWVEKEMVFALKDERILETELSSNYLTRFKLVTGLESGSRTLVDQPFANRESVSGLPPTTTESVSRRFCSRESFILGD